MAAQRTTVDPHRPALRIGLVGHGFIARAHALAWQIAEQVFRLPARPALAVLAGRDEQRAQEAATELGFGEAASDWRRLVERPDIDVVDICTPVASHAEIAEAALGAGKHVLCEKPLARTSAEAARLAELAAAASALGQVAMVGFNYRRIPAVALAQALCADGRLGRLRHIRARYLQDWLAHEDAPWSWRLDAAQAGAGALGDLGSHLIDLVGYVTGARLERVSGTVSTFVASRVPAGPRAGADVRRPVTVDDACSFFARDGNGATALFEATRCALGRKNELTLELEGTEGSLAFDLERLNELRLYSELDESETRGFRTVLVTEPAHPYLSAWWPPGHVLGWDHAFVHQARDFVEAAVEGAPYAPDFSDGLYVQHVLEAVLASAASGAREQAVRGAASREPDASLDYQVTGRGASQP